MFKLTKKAALAEIERRATNRELRREALATGKPYEPIKAADPSLIAMGGAALKTAAGLS